MSNVMLSTDEVNRIALYCGEEVRRQYAYTFDEPHALRVSGMIEAWMLALETDFSRGSITPELIETLGALIETEKNARGFRRIPIFVGYERKLDHKLVRRAIEQLCDNIEALPAFDAYRQFEEIHPFVDGNGRTGKVILNWLNGTLLDPIFPPSNFWGDKVVNP